VAEAQQFLQALVVGRPGFELLVPRHFNDAEALLRAACENNKLALARDLVVHHIAEAPADMSSFLHGLASAAFAEAVQARWGGVDWSSAFDLCVDKGQLGLLHRILEANLASSQTQSQLYPLLTHKRVLPWADAALQKSRTRYGGPPEYVPLASFLITNDFIVPTPAHLSLLLMYISGLYLPEHMLELFTQALSHGGVVDPR
jgi:hypothetical protein